MCLCVYQNENIYMLLIALKLFIIVNLVSMSVMNLQPNYISCTKTQINRDHYYKLRSNQTITNSIYLGLAACIILARPLD